MYFCIRLLNPNLDYVLQKEETPVGISDVDLIRETLNDQSFPLENIDDTIESLDLEYVDLPIDEDEARSEENKVYYEHTYYRTVCLDGRLDPNRYVKKSVQTYDNLGTTRAYIEWVVDLDKVREDFQNQQLIVI